MAAELPIGTLLESSDGAHAHVLARKLNRHTFWCGQSGSGKTYALGVLLEQVMLETELPLVILDPNSDFVRLGEMRAGADRASADELRSRDVRVLGRNGDHDLRVQFTNLPLKSKAAVAQIDPILDADEYNHLLRLEDEVHAIDDRDLVPHLRPRGRRCTTSSPIASKTWGSASGICGRGADATSATTSTSVRMRPSWTSAGFRHRRSRGLRRSPCSTICGSTARSASDGSS